MNTARIAGCMLSACLVAAMVACTGKDSDRTPGSDRGGRQPDALGVEGMTEQADAQDADLKALADGNNRFAIDLYKKLAEKERGNIVISPFSVRTALAMTCAGARGETAAEIARVLHLDVLPPDRLHAAVGSLVSHISQQRPNKPFELSVANGLWAQERQSLSENFTKIAQIHYQSFIHQVDFRDPAYARQRINSWVDQKTSGKINDLLSQSDIRATTRLVITNAIYFKSQWELPFPKAATREDVFYEKTDITCTASMMLLENVRLRNTASASWDVVELPYQDRQFAMLLLLPTKRHGLADMESKLTASEFRDLVRGLQTGYQKEVAVPKFIVRGRTPLREHMEGMGMKLAFSPGANFSGLIPSGGQGISEMIHEGVADVDEQGTVAAAATAVLTQVNNIRGARRYRFDQPFMFIIIDNISNSIMFIGRIARP